MRYSEKKTDYFREKIRNIMLENERISSTEVGELLAEYGINLCKNTICKYMRKVYGEFEHTEIDTKNKIVVKMDGRKELRKKELHSIVKNQASTPMERISALRALKEEDESFLEVLMKCGILEKHLGEGKMIHELNPDTQKALEDLTACLSVQFGERMKPVIYEEAIIHEQTNDKPEQPKPVGNPNIKQLPNGAVVDTKGPNVIEI